jgi:Protein of unknown function (DUF732)
MRNLLIAGVAALAAITFITPMAHADPIDQVNQRRQQEFTNYMAAHGYPSDWSATRGVSYLDQGSQVCTALQQGQSEGSQIGRLEGIVSRAEASLIVTAAHQYLCPGA